MYFSGRAGSPTIRRPSGGGGCQGLSILPTAVHEPEVVLRIDQPFPAAEPARGRQEHKRPTKSKAAAFPAPLMAPPAFLQHAPAMTLVAVADTHFRRGRACTARSDLDAPPLRADDPPPRITGRARINPRSGPDPARPGIEAKGVDNVLQKDLRFVQFARARAGGAGILLGFGENGVPRFPRAGTGGTPAPDLERPHGSTLRVSLGEGNLKS
jgi:hypothetical protein